MKTTVPVKLVLVNVKVTVSVMEVPASLTELRTHVSVLSAQVQPWNDMPPESGGQETLAVGGAVAHPAGLLELAVYTIE